MPTTTAKAPTPKKLATRSEAARDRLDAWVREVVAWHFDPRSGTPCWLDWAKQAGCDPRNLASVRVMERIGMRREAHLIETRFVKGEWVSDLVHAILAAEWRAQRDGADTPTG